MTCTLSTVHVILFPLSLADSKFREVGSITPSHAEHPQTSVEATPTFGQLVSNLFINLETAHMPIGFAFFLEISAGTCKR